MRTIKMMNEIKQLSFGIFWIISDNVELEDCKLLCFNVSCDTYGNVTESPSIPLNSKSGTSYNHQALWDSQVKNNSQHKPYNRKGYNHYPRGRVEIANNKAVIYLNPIINQPQIIDDIKAQFGLCDGNISRVRIIPDNSKHYASFIE